MEVPEAAGGAARRADHRSSDPAGFCRERKKEEKLVGDETHNIMFRLIKPSQILKVKNIHTEKEDLVQT